MEFLDIISVERVGWLYFKARDACRVDWNAVDRDLRYRRFEVNMSVQNLDIDVDRPQSLLQVYYLLVLLPRHLAFVVNWVSHFFFARNLYFGLDRAHLIDIFRLIVALFVWREHIVHLQLGQVLVENIKFVGIDHG